MKQETQQMMPKEFIQKVLIDEIGQIVQTHPYLSFNLMVIGIEFLGKCMLKEIKEWHTRDSRAVVVGFDLLHKGDERYRSLNLKDNLRNGFAHVMLPKSIISLSEEKHEEVHFSVNSRGKTVLVVERFYEDFVRCCESVIAFEFEPTDKMNKKILNIGK